MKYLAICVVLLFATMASAQDSLADRVARLEQGMERLKSIESKQDATNAALQALSVKVDLLANPLQPPKVATTAPKPQWWSDPNNFALATTVCAPGSNCSQAPTTVFTAADGTVYTYSNSASACGSSDSASACGSAGSSGACGASGSFRTGGPIRRFLFSGHFRQ